ncbi:hypothetical protein F4803DRAFT_441663 [Xylaria telfairii]|nr:hypothetical protein F4803DRAFT_441663 [Xylaria telfairii]
MCHFNYWGYDGCSHELLHIENRWTLCPLGEHTAPRDCPFAGYTRHKIGRPFCQLCLDEVPPNHAPVTRIILDFDNLRKAMELSVDQATLATFVRDYREGLRRIRESSFLAGPDNNFYDQIWALYHNFHERAVNEMSAAWTAFETPPRDPLGASSGFDNTSAAPSYPTPGYYGISPEFQITMAGIDNATASIDSTVMPVVSSTVATVDITTTAGFDNITHGSDSTTTETGNTYGYDTTSSGFDSTSPM